LFWGAHTLDTLSPQSFYFPWFNYTSRVQFIEAKQMSK
jgi:hypothetical protein